MACIVLHSMACLSSRAKMSLRNWHRNQSLLLKLRGAATAIPNLRLLELSVALDRHIVGQADAKMAVVLGLISCEHVYIEGPPGVGKTRLAEIASDTAGLSRFIYQFHRDTRVDELIGDSTIMRERIAEGEVIRQGVRPGGILTAHICVLDDISRAPGEALNVLLRLLNERSYNSKPLKLRCAIATGNPTREEFFNEPLDPAVLDRFALQVSLGGIVRGKNWDAAARVVRQHCALSSGPDVSDIIQAFTSEFWHAVDKDLRNVELPEDILQTLLAILDALVSEPEVERSHLSLLTDRTFLVKAPRVMRAHALLEGRKQCTQKDLQVLRFLTRFRVPQPVHERIDEIIQNAVQQRRSPEQQKSKGSTPGSSSGDSSNSNDETGLPEAQAVPNERKDSNTQQEDPKSEKVARFVQYLMSAIDWLFRYLEPPKTPSLTLDHHEESNMRIEGGDALLASLHGSLQRSSADRWPEAGGVPRGWRTMRRLSEMAEADISALSRWCDMPTPTLPRAAFRQRIERGGALAVIRDVSDSMMRPDEEYLLARCAAATTCGIVELARQSRMRIGYLEFGDLPKKHFTRDSGAQFFTRDYSGIERLAQNLGTRGGTNYELALRAVLAEFDRLAQSRGLNQRMHVVMLSDGEPTEGSRELEEEREWAQRLGVCIHTIFVGDGHFPPELARLSVDTSGKRFHAIPDYKSGFIKIVDVSTQHVLERWNWRSLFSGPRQANWHAGVANG